MSGRPARETAARRLARVQGRRGIREPVEALRSEQRVGAALLAGGIAYRLFLWLLPFGLVVAGIAGFWVRLSEQSLEEAARTFGLSGIAAHSATLAIEQGSRARWYFIAAGSVLMTWAGIEAVRALRVAARLAWGLPLSRLRRPLLASAGFTSVATLGLAVSVGASWARHRSLVGGILASVGDAVVFSVLALSALRRLPHPDGLRWRALWPGALLAGVGLGGTEVFLAYYLARRLERAPALYGTLGAASVVLLVLFVIARLLVWGMFLDAAIGRIRAEGRDAHEPQEPPAVSRAGGPPTTGRAP